MKKLFIAILVVISSFLLASCGQKAVEKIEIKSGLNYTYYVGDTPDFSNVKVNVYYNDGDTSVVGYNELAFSDLDTSVAGDKKLVITYKEASITINVTVKEKSATPPDDGGDEDQSPVDYTVFGVEYDSNIKDFMAAGGNKVDFVDKDRNYVVGNVNKFYFNLVLTVMDVNATPKTVTDYVATSSVYLVEDNTETLLEGEALAAYVTIDENEHSFDFTAEAEGKTFKLVTRPLYGIYEGDEEEKSKSLVVDVVNAYNVYKAWELNLVTNNTSKIHQTQVVPNDVATSFLNNHSVTRPENLAGVVIHKNFTLQPTDLPQEYFYTLENDIMQGDSVLYEKGTQFLYDHFALFNYEFQKNSSVKEFSVYGNYFTIYTHQIPIVAPSGYANNDNDLSAVEVFMFGNEYSFEKTGGKMGKETPFNHEDYKANMISLSLRDDDGSDNETQANMRHMLGLIGVKAYKCVTNIVNTNIQAYYISLHAIRDCLTVNITDSQFYNAWQNHILTWSENDLQREHGQSFNAENIHSNHTNITVNVKNSKIAKCGGPAIINMVCNPTWSQNSLSSVDINIDTASQVYSYVTGQEAWFTAFNATDTATTIMSLNGLFKASGGSGSYTTTLPGNGETQFFNMIMANIPYVTSAADLLKAGDIDGTFRIGDELLLDMDDSQYGNYGDPYVAGYAAHSMLGKAPIFRSNNGTVAAGVLGIQGVPNGLYQAANTQTGLAPAAASINEGEYLTLYYSGIGIVFSFNDVIDSNSNYA